jgi:hypothetical protein
VLGTNAIEWRDTERGRPIFEKRIFCHPTLGGSCSLCLTLDELARDWLGSFCFILLAMEYRGATGCPMRSIALV